MKSLDFFKIIIKFQIVVAFVGSLILLNWSRFDASMSFLIGVIISSLSFFGLWWPWHRIFLKKTIALAVSVIVFKYAIIGFSIYKILSLEMIQQGYFLFGLGVIVPSIVFGALILSHKNPVIKRKQSGTF